MHKCLKLVWLVISVYFFSSCSGDTDVAVKEIKDSACVPQYTNDSIPLSDPSKTYTEEEPDTIHLDLGEFELYFPGLAMYNSDKIKPADTIEISPEITSYTDSISIHVKQKDIAWLQFSEQYQTTLSVHNEGPHIELYDWKSFCSEWAKPDSIAPDHIRLKIISKEEASRFPDFTKKDLIAGLKGVLVEESGNTWVDIIQHPPYGKWTDCYWIGVGVRRLLITGVSKSGKTIHKLIIIYPPMGC